MFHGMSKPKNKKDKNGRSSKKGNDNNEKDYSEDNLPHDDESL